MNVLFAIALPAKLESLEKLMRSISDCAKAQGFQEKRIREIELAAEEALVNIFNYSYPGRPGEVEVACKAEEDCFTVEIVDSGIPFDMTSLSDPDITLSTEERRIGGLGVFLIKKMVDEVRYRRENDRNILALIIKKRKDVL